MSMELVPVVGGAVVIGGVQELISVIKNILNFIKDQWQSIVYYTICFTANDNPRCKRAIIEKIRSANLHLKGSKLEMCDGGTVADYSVPDRCYVIDDDDSVGKVYVTVEKDKFTIQACKIPPFVKTTMNDFRNYVEEIYSTYNSPSRVMMFYTPNQDSWIRAIPRIPRNYEKLQKTPEMLAVLDDVQKFMNAREDYEDHGFAYRKGYLFIGKPGTGKTTLMEIIANEYGMQVYQLTLNANNLTDTNLINLVCAIPARSLLVIDEIDRQLKALERNKTANVTMGGILTALDGPHRLPEQTIVVITANDLSFLPDVDRASLLRKGRIDATYEFKNVIS